MAWGVGAGPLQRHSATGDENRSMAISVANSEMHSRLHLGNIAMLATLGRRTPFGSGKLVGTRGFEPPTPTPPV